MIISQLASKNATAETIFWLQKEFMPRTSVIASNTVATSDTAWTVTSGDGNTVFRVNDVVRVMETNEAFLVTSVSANSVGSLTASRGLGSSSAATAQTGSHLVVIGNASPQGAGSGTALITQAASASNYTQIFRHPFSFSETETAISEYGGSEPEREMGFKAIEHGRAIENSMFFGAKELLSATDTTSHGSTTPQGLMGGLLEYISTNVTATTGGALTPAAVDTFLEGCLYKGSMNKAIFCAPRPGTVLSQMYRGLWHPPDNTNNEVFGVKVSAWLEGTYGGTIPIFVKREWGDMTVGTSTYGSYLFLVDMDHVRFRPLQTRNTHIRRNIQEPSADRETHEFMTECSFECANEAAHGILKNIQTYSAS